MTTTTHHDGTAPTHAVIIGAGLAGLFAARVLGDHFDRITIVERDPLPKGPDARSGVPQGRHFHSFLTAGARLMEQLFPGIGADLEQEGAPAVDTGFDGLALFPFGYLLRRRTGLVVHACSRDMREWQVRRRIEANPKVTFIDGCEVAGLVSAGNDVTGIRLRLRSGGDHDGAPKASVVNADLVVDASGRSSHNLQWLGELGHEAPEVLKVTSQVGYASRLVRFKNGPGTDFKFLVDAGSAPDRYRAGAIAQIERGNWIVTMLGMGGNPPPSDEDGFLEWARALRIPLIHELLKSAEPITPIHAFRRTENSFRRFEKMRRWPGRFVVLGDAAVCFNPVYGQGMTMGALSAFELGAWLREHRARSRDPRSVGPTLDFQKRLARLSQAPWLLATGADFRWPNAEGPAPPAALRIAQHYGDNVLSLASDDPEAQQVLLEILGMVTPGYALFRPTLAAKLVRRTLASRLGAAMTRP